jgi:Aldehyde dehydrogenase family
VLASIIGAAFDQREVACPIEPDLELARAPVQLPFDHTFFTGSRQVVAAAAGNLTTVTLELGGNSALVVDATADVACEGRAEHVGEIRQCRADVRRARRCAAGRADPAGLRERGAPRCRQVLRADRSGQAGFTRVPALR